MVVTSYDDCGQASGGVSASSGAVSQKGRQALTSVYLPVETRERLQQLAKRSRISMAACLRESVEDLLKKYEEPKKRNTK
jgi:hypothetical protein